MQRDTKDENDEKGDKTKDAEFVPLTYSEIIPDFNSFNKNKKKKLRK